MEYVSWNLDEKISIVRILIERRLQFREIVITT